MLYLTGNDVHPRGNTEVFFGAVANLAGAIMMVNMFGELAILTDELGADRREREVSMDMATAVMVPLKVP